jgi:LysR family transcriptional regulator for metE and metH
MELAEEQMKQFALGQRGTLRIGMECHPCYQWLLKVAGPFMRNWPDVDLDVRQKFQFGGIGALFSHEIDLLVTPDPLLKAGLRYEPVFDYELVLVVGRQHPLASVKAIEPHMLSEEVLITYPVEIGRLDIYSQFLQPAGISPRRRKIIETTDIMLQMVASGRGVAALPRWLIEESDADQGLVPVKLGNEGIAKQIFLGIRQEDMNVAFIADFLKLARAPAEPAQRHVQLDQTSNAQ